MDETTLTAINYLKVNVMHRTDFLFLIPFFMIINITCLFGDTDTPQVSSTEIKYTQNELKKLETVHVQSPKSIQIISDAVKIPYAQNQSFTAVGIRVNHSGYENEISIYLRSLDAAGNISEWLQIKNDDDIEGAEYNFIGQLYFVNKSVKQVQYKIISRTDVEITGVSIVFINPGTTTPQQKSIVESKRNLLSKTSADDFELPPVVSRTEWGCPDGQGSRWTPAYTNVTHLIVHHSATENTSNDWPGVVRTFWEWHTINNGWGDIGYNFLVDPTGVVYEGRSGGNNAIGAHFCGTNSGTMGTCVIGTYTNVSPTNAAIESLVKILAWKCNLEGIDPLGVSFHSPSSRNLNHISGHRDGCSTECPGTTLYNSLGTVRNEVATLLSNTAPVAVAPELNSLTENYLAYKPIEITFSSSMDQESVEAALSIEPFDTIKVLWTGPKEMRISPDGLWEFSTEYLVTISEEAKSLFGTGLDGDADGNPGGIFSFSFRTTEPDTEAPVIVKGFPEGEGINTKAEMKFVFNEEVDGIIGRVGLLDSTKQTVSITDGKIINENNITYITFRPTKELNPGSTYYVELKAGLSDFIGNKFESDTLISFATITEQFESINVINDFSESTDWMNPEENPLTAGVEEGGVLFTTSSTKKISSSTSGFLSYHFLEGWQGVVALTTATEIMVYDSSEYIGIWIFGDLSFNELVFGFTGDSEFEYVYGAIDWFGWDFIKINLDEIPGETQSLKHIIVRHSSAGDLNGQLYFDDIQTGGTITDVENPPNSVASLFNLHQNYPNPFNPSTVIRFSIPTVDALSGVGVHVSLKIYDILGSEIATLVNGIKAPGYYEVEFNASQLPSGVYFYRLTSGNYTDSKKMLLLK